MNEEVIRIGDLDCNPKEHIGNCSSTYARKKLCRQLNDIATTSEARKELIKAAKFVSSWACSYYTGEVEKGEFLNKSGDMAYILGKTGNEADLRVLQAAMLRDILLDARLSDESDSEDCLEFERWSDEICEEFGPVVAGLVREVTAAGMVHEIIGNYKFELVVDKYLTMPLNSDLSENAKKILLADTLWRLSYKLPVNRSFGGQVGRHLDQASLDLFNYWGASEEIEDQLEQVFHQQGYRRTLIPEICGFRIFRKKKTAAHANKID